MKNLKNTQVWVQEVITQPNGVQTGASSAPFLGESKNIEGMILPSKYLSSEQRIGIYQNAYLARLLECFRSEYNGLLNAIGADLFEHLVRTYLQEHPSTSYTLNKLGEHFPKYLKNSLKENLKGEAPDWWQLFIIDMAKYERKYLEVFNGEGHEEKASNDIFGVEPLQLSPATRTLTLQFPIADCIGKFRDNETEHFPAQKETHYVFSRQNYRIEVFALEVNEWEALNQWIESPKNERPPAYADQWRLKGIGYS